MITGFFGLPRSGKTYLMSMYGLYFVKKKYPVYSNYPLKGAYKLNFQDVVNGVMFKENAVLLLTEMHNYANSREWEKLSPDLFFLFSQGGKANLRLFYDAQDSSRVDKILRENTNYFYYVNSLIYKNEMKAEAKLKKWDILGRILVVDKYTTNYDFSFRKSDRASRSFHFINWKILNTYDSFYFIKEFNFDKKEVFEKWQI